MKFAVALFLLLAASAHSRTLLESSPECQGPEDCGPEPKQPKYSVIERKGLTEIREYENATWAVSFGRSVFGIDVAAALAAKHLVGYFAGANNDHVNIPPSIPLITTIGGHPHHPHPHPPHPPKNGSHPEPPKNGSHPHPPHHPPHPGPPPPPPGPVVVVAAYVSPKVGAPRPDDRHVKLLKTNTTKVYVHEFGGYAISWFVKREIKHLAGDLKELGVKPCKGKFFVATYDGPWKVFNRRNEIWWTETPHHHNKTEHSPEELVFELATLAPFGFEAMDPDILFAEEMPPPPPHELEDGPEEERPQELLMAEDLEDNEDDNSLGEWITQPGQSAVDILEVV